jgi:hypothetical protein
MDFDELPDGTTAGPAEMCVRIVCRGLIVVINASRGGSTILD